MQLLFSLIFFISRLSFLNWGNVFFDSKEYLSRLADTNLINALTNGHPPLHSGLILTFWPLFQLSKLIGLNPAMVMVLGQVVLAFLTVWLFYKTVCLLINNDVAWKASVIFSVIPIFWIVNEAVMMETTYLFYWIASLFFLIKYLTNKKTDNKNLLLSSIFWIMAFLTHTVVIMWIPLFIYIAFTVNKNKTLSLWKWGVGVLLVASLINAVLLSKTYNTNILGGFYWLYGAKFGEHAAFVFNLESILRYVRNWMLPLGYNNSWVLLLLAFFGLIKWFKKDLKIFWLTILWILPSLVTNQWWDSLLYGRHSLIVSFALAFLAASVLNKVWFRIFTVLLLAVSISAVILLKQSIPYIEMAKVANNLPNGLFIDSHFSRPQTDGEFFGQMVFVDEPNWVGDKLSELIDSYLKNNKPVYVTGQALSEPYGLFSGPYIHPLAMSYKSGFILSYLSQKYHFVKVASVNDSLNLNVYRIMANPGSYPEINRLDKSRRRIDWLDPLRVLVSPIL